MAKLIVSVSDALTLALDKIQEIDKGGMSCLAERTDLTRLCDMLSHVMVRGAESVILSKDEYETLFY